MALNCKPGDLAVMVRSNAGNEGVILQCIRIASLDELRSAPFTHKLGPVWIVDKPLMTDRSNIVPMAVDSFLRPLRDNPGQDETLQWLDVPHKEAA